jgi:prepilin-type N-terminal cleavage/methylation domain-containing protein
MSGSHSQRGFTLLGILIVVVIICILSMGGLQVYTGAGGKATDYKPDTVRGGLNLSVLRTTLKSLAMTQAMEYDLRRQYIPDIQQLINQSYGVGYHARATDRVPLIPMFDLVMEVTSNSFTIKAIPNALRGAPRDCPTYVIDQTMNIREE